MILLKLLLTIIHELGIADVTWEGDMCGTHSEESVRELAHAMTYL